MRATPFVEILFEEILFKVELDTRDMPLLLSPEPLVEILLEKIVLFAALLSPIPKLLEVPLVLITLNDTLLNIVLEFR